jgi:hypothetical protein
MKRKMTRFAFGAWWGSLAPNGTPAAKACRWAKAEAASQPKPQPVVWRKVRREENILP